jgi:hypothetical protein
MSVIQPLLNGRAHDLLAGLRRSRRSAYPLPRCRVGYGPTSRRRHPTDPSLCSQHLIAKVYFPRVLVPLAAVLMPAVDLVISFGMLLVLLAWYHVTPGAGVVLLPLYAALGILTAFAVTLWTSALSVRYRDARYVLPFVIQIWLFVTPVAYPASMIPERWRQYALNYGDGR